MRGRDLGLSSCCCTDSRTAPNFGSSRCVQSCPLYVIAHFVNSSNSSNSSWISGLYILADCQRLQNHDANLLPRDNLRSALQIPVLVQSGYRVVAPDLKGFGQSDKPQDPALYAMPYLIKDVIGILNQLQIEKVHCVVGHDWGAAVAWQLAGRFPKRFERLVALSVGHNASMFSLGGNRQREKSWYMLYFKVHSYCWPSQASPLHSPHCIASYNFQDSAQACCHGMLLRLEDRSYS